MSVTMCTLPLIAWPSNMNTLHSTCWWRVGIAFWARCCKSNTLIGKDGGGDGVGEFCKGSSFSEIPLLGVVYPNPLKPLTKLFFWSLQAADVAADVAGKKNLLYLIKCILESNILLVIICKSFYSGLVHCIVFKNKFCGSSSEPHSAV